MSFTFEWDEENAKKNEREHQGSTMKEYASELQSIIIESQKWLQQIDEEKATSVPGSHWMVKEILGHLIDSACNNHHRFIRLQQGNLVDFPGYDQNHWVERAGYGKMTWKHILELWISYNELLVALIVNIDESQQRNYWDQPDRTLEFLVKDYLRHVNHHLNQIQPAVS